MATMSAIQIAEIAAKLFKTWKDSGTSSESNPLTLEMVLNVVKLAAGDPSSKVAAAVTVVEALPKVIDFVAKLQSRLNSHRRDGVLDVRTWERVKQVLRGCGGGVVHPGTGVQRQGLPAPAVQQFKRIMLGQGTHQRGFRRGHGQDLQGQLGDDTERAQTACHETRHVVTGHVLHDLAAKGERLAQAIEQLHAQHMVAHTADIGAGWARQTRSDHATHRGTRAEVRRLLQALEQGAPV